MSFETKRPTQDPTQQYQHLASQFPQQNLDGVNVEQLMVNPMNYLGQQLSVQQHCLLLQQNIRQQQGWLAHLEILQRQHSQVKQQILLSQQRLKQQQDQPSALANQMPSFGQPQLFQQVQKSGDDEIEKPGPVLQQQLSFQVSARSPKQQRQSDQIDPMLFCPNVEVPGEAPMASQEAEQLDKADLKPAASKRTPRFKKSTQSTSSQLIEFQNLANLQHTDPHEEQDDQLQDLQITRDMDARLRISLINKLLTNKNLSQQQRRALQSRRNTAVFRERRRQKQKLEHFFEVELDEIQLNIARKGTVVFPIRKLPVPANYKFSLK